MIFMDSSCPSFVTRVVCMYGALGVSTSSLHREMKHSLKVKINVLL